jgi:hypothetical protein
MKKIDNRFIDKKKGSDRPLEELLRMMDQAVQSSRIESLAFCTTLRV